MDPVLVLVLIFKGTCILFFAVAAPTHSCTNSTQGLPFSHILVVFLVTAILTGVRWYLMWFLFTFLWWLVMLHIFLCLLAVCVFFGNMSESSAPFKLDSLVFCYWVVWVPHTYWILTPYQIHDLQIFSPFLRLPFLSSSSSFFWPCFVACSVLIPLSGIKLVCPAVEAWSSNHQANREFCFFTLLVVSFAVQELFSLIFLLFCFLCVCFWCHISRKIGAKINIKDIFPSAFF